MADQTVEWKEVKSFLRRRRKSFAILFLIIFISSIFLAFVIPPIYQAQSTILIEEQQIPENIVQSTITSYAEERLNSIKEQVLSFDRLKKIIEEFELYPEIRLKYGFGEAVAEMRKSISLEPKSASFVNPRTGKSMAATIAFVLYYEGRDPATARDVTNVLGKLFLEEDVRMREKITSTTAGFLEAELENLKKQIQEHEREISVFKQTHFGELPEHNQVNLTAVARLERELDRVDMELRNLRERKLNLEGQIATVDPLLPIKVDGQNMARNPSEQLKYLRLKLLSLQSVFSDKHPDILKLKSEIRKLESQVDVPFDSREARKRVDSLGVKLAALSGEFGEKHPDVVKLKKEIEILEKSIGEAPTDFSRMKEESPDNPTYVHLSTQVSTIDTRIRNLEGDKLDIQDELAKYRNRIEVSPFIEKEYSELTRDYQGAKHKYDDLMNKLMTAKVAKGMEEGQYGQRFEIKSRAYLPVKPYKPNRIAIILLGFVLGIGVGFGIAAIREFFDHSVKSDKELAALANVPVLTVIPKVETSQERIAKVIRRSGWVFGACVLVLIGVKIIDAYVMPLPELWEIIQNNAKNM